MAGSELEMPVAGEIVMTELAAGLMVSLKSELVRLLGDILAPQQRRLNNGEESGVTPDSRYQA